MNYFPSSTPLLALELILVPMAAITSQDGQQRLATLGDFFCKICSREKEGAQTLCNNMDGTGEHYAK